MIKSAFKPAFETALRLGAALLAFLFYRVLFYGMNSGLFPAVDLAEFSRLILIGLRFDLAGLAYFNLPYAVLALLPLPALRRGTGAKAVFALYMVSNGLASALSSIDLVYYRYTLARSTRDLWSVATLGNDAGHLIIPIIAQYWYVPLIFAMVMAWLRVAYKKASLGGREEKIPLIYGLLVLILFSGGMVVLIRGGFQLRPMDISQANHPAGGQNAPLVTNTPYVMARTFRKTGLPKFDYKGTPDPAVKVNPLHAPAPGPMLKKNVVVIIMESMALEYLAPPWGRLGLTPFFDSLKEKGLFFPNSFANGKQSIEAMPAIVASIPSLGSDAFTTSLYAGNTIESMSGLLAGKGYRTLFFHGGRTGTMGFDNFARSAGFARYAGMEDYPGGTGEAGEWGIPDGPFLSFFEDELKTTGEPFLAVFFSLSAHHPFKLPAPYEGKFPEGPHPITKMVSYADEALKLFFEKAARSPYFENTLFVITADHAGPALSPEAGSRAGAYRIPILFYAPGDPSLKGVSLKTSQQLDIMPTVLDYLGYGEKYFSLGQNMLGGGGGLAVNRRSGEYLCVSAEKAVTASSEEFTGYYDLTADPRMAAPLADSNKFAELKSECASFLKTYSQTMRKNKMTAENYEAAP